MHTSDQILKLVNDTLDNLAYDRKPSSLYEPIRYVLSLGGKRIRPVLMLLAYNLFKDDPESIIMPACGLSTLVFRRIISIYSSSATSLRCSKSISYC